MRRSRTPRTDVGTVILHWLLVATLVVSAATGLRIASDDPRLAFLAWTQALLPQGDVWPLHMTAGLALIAIACAYVAYLRHAHLIARIRLDRVRLSGLRGRKRARWGALNVLLIWILFSALITVFASGLMLYSGRGGAWVDVHLAAAAVVVAFPVLHVIGHLAYGGTSQLLRVLRPTLELAPPQPSLIDMLAEEVQRHSPPGVDRQSSPRQQPSSPPTLHAHPLVSAFVAALLATAVATGLDRGSSDTLLVARIATTETPTLDGDLSDPAWRHTTPIRVHTANGANLGGTGASQVEIRAVHDGTTAYIAFTWEDPTRSLKHLPMIKRADGWRLLHEAYDIEDEDDYYEDKFAVMLARTDTLGGGSAHLGQKPLPGKPPAFSGRGLHYTADGAIVDVWHWKAARGGLLGFADDNYFGAPADPKPEEIAGRSRYKAGYLTDPGKVPFANNFKNEAPGGYRGPITPLRLPKDLAATQRAMMRVALDPDQGEPDGARWWLMAEESVPYSAALEQKIPVGTVIPGVVITGTYEGDRADVRCGARWAAGRWTLEIARRLDTGSPYDLAIANGIFMWVAVFDHSQTRHTRHLRPIRLEVKA